MWSRAGYSLQHFPPLTSPFGLCSNKVTKYVPADCPWLDAGPQWIRHCAGTSLMLICVCTCFGVGLQDAKIHPHPLFFPPPACYHGDASHGWGLWWSPLTLADDLWPLGHGQGQKGSNGRRATRALRWLAPWHPLWPSSRRLFHLELSTY